MRARGVWVILWHLVVFFFFVCSNTWIETTRRADFKLILGTQLKALVMLYLAAVAWECSGERWRRENKYHILWMQQLWKRRHIRTQTYMQTHPRFSVGEVSTSVSSLRGVCGCLWLYFHACFVQLAGVFFLCVCVFMPVSISGKGKGRKCSRGKWINGRIQQRHSKQSSHTPDWRRTIHVYMRARGSRWWRRTESREKNTAGGSDRAV